MHGDIARLIAASEPSMVAGEMGGRWLGMIVIDQIVYYATNPVYDTADDALLAVQEVVDAVKAEAFEECAV